MRINHIVVKNYRGAVDCDVDLRRTRNVAVFAGSNGSGKTSLLEACRMVLGQNYGVRPVPAYPHEVIVEVAGNDGKNYRFCHTEKGYAVYDGAGKAEGITEDFVVRTGLTANWFFTSWRDPHLTDGVQLQTENGDAPIPGRTREETLVWIKNTLVRWDVMAQFNKDPAQIEQIKAVLERLRNAWGLFFPDRRCAFVSRSVSHVLQKNGFASASPETNFKFDLYLQRESDRKLISINDLSSGELEVFCFLGVLLLNTGLSQVYIDEPELHLNQQWHSTLLRAMQIVAPRVQFLVATHSPEIWNSVDVDQRFLLENGRVYA